MSACLILSAPTGETLLPGTVHHMIIRMEARGAKRVIEDIEVEMPTVPRQECRESLDSLLPFEGLPIGSGFSNRVKDLVGGPKGCAHLVALITAMAPAAVQEVRATTTCKPRHPAAFMPGAVERIKDTCRIWRSDNPLVKAIEKQSPT